MSDPIKYYVMAGEEQKGPYTLAQLQTMWKAGSLTIDTQYWFAGQSEWMPLSTILELLEPQERPRTAQAYFTMPAQRVWSPGAANNQLLVLGILSLFLFPFTAVPGIIIGWRQSALSMRGRVGYALCWGCMLVFCIEMTGFIVMHFRHSQHRQFDKPVAGNVGGVPELGRWLPAV